MDLKEVMASKDKIYMVMEFMSGGELFDKIVADGPLEVSLSLSVHAQTYALVSCSRNAWQHTGVNFGSVILFSVHLL